MVKFSLRRICFIQVSVRPSLEHLFQGDRGRVRELRGADERLLAATLPKAGVLVHVTRPVGDVALDDRPQR